MSNQSVRIAIIGLGYVGLAVGASLAKFGNKIIFMDKSKEKIEELKRRESVACEPGLDKILKTIDFEVTYDLNYAVRNSDITFICVGTMTSVTDGSTDLKQVKEVARRIGKALSNYHLVVVKSTVMPGTTKNILVPLLEGHGKKASSDFGVCVNPEFLREGSAIEDCLYPSRIVIGEIDKKSGDILADLYRNFDCPVLRFDLRTAEMVKYASNAFLATKISFINEIGNICQKLGIDAYEVARAMGYDKRIGDEFLNAGAGFGGSCLPKDLRALIAKAREVEYEPTILEEVLKLNERQPFRMIELVKKYIPCLENRHIGILGLAFKPNTNDIRESKAIKIVDALLNEGARVKAYDPMATENFKRLFPQVEYTDPGEVLKCDAILILTEWQEFEDLDYKGKFVIDGRRILKAKEASVYQGICW